VNSEPNLSSDLTHEDYHWIAESAYYKALARSFKPGHDKEDWLEARKDYETEILSKQQRNGLVWLISDKLIITSCLVEPINS
jgi:hypothetical protein